MDEHWVHEDDLSRCEHGCDGPWGGKLKCFETHGRTIVQVYDLVGGPANGQFVDAGALAGMGGLVFEGGPFDGTRYLLVDGVLVYCNPEAPLPDEAAEVFRRIEEQ